MEILLNMLMSDLIFFRRAHQKTKTPKFYCKQNNACEITVKNRRRCQKCRYDLCLKIGMTPKAVLTEDQKKIRFKNAIKKKEVRSSQNISPEFIGNKWLLIEFPISMYT